MVVAVSLAFLFASSLAFCFWRKSQVGGNVGTRPQNQIVSTLDRGIPETSKTSQPKAAFDSLTVETAARIDLIETLGQKTPDYNSIHSIAFSKNGKLLASASGDNTVRIWNLENRTEIHKLVGHIHDAYSVSFNPEGTMLASAGGDGIVRLWNPESGQLIKKIQGFTADTYASFSPDGKTLAACSGDDETRIYDTSWHVIRSLGTPVERPDLNLSCYVGFSPDGKLLASNKGSGLRLWDPSTGKLIRTLRYAGTFAFSSDSKLIAIGRHVLDVSTGQVVRIFKTPDESSQAFSLDGRMLALGGDDGRISLWDLSTGNQIRTLKDPVRGEMGYQLIVSAEFSPDGSLLVTGSYYNTLTLWAARAQQ
jgi:WD40 repeat protein